jgi:hypothetical protein
MMFATDIPHEKRSMFLERIGAMLAERGRRFTALGQVGLAREPELIPSWQLVGIRHIVGKEGGQMSTFGIAEIAKLSGLSIRQVEQAISREGMQVKGKGRPRQFETADAFNFCVIGAMRRLGIDWKRSVVGSTAFPWPISDAIEINEEFFLLTPLDDDGSFDIDLVRPKQIVERLKSFKTSAGILIDANAIAKRIETFARKRRWPMTRGTNTERRRCRLRKFIAARPPIPALGRNAEGLLCMTSEISADTPLRLKTAVRLAFPDGGMTVSGLRREAAKGHLAIETIAGKQFTTLNAIQEMRKQCRDNPRVRDCGLNQSEKKMGNSANGQCGLSAMDRTRLARAALEENARTLNVPSPNISQPNISHRGNATVTPLKR